MIKHWKNISLENIEGEVWQPIVKYIGLYEVSNMGRVKSLPRYKKNRGCGYVSKTIILRQGFTGSKKYLGVTLVTNNKGVWHSVARLVATAFIPNPKRKATVNHLWGVTDDNRVSELGWATYKEQKEHAIKVLGAINFGKGERCPRALLNNKEILKIRKLYAGKKYNQTQLGNMFGVCQAHISDIILKKTWSHI